MAITLNIYVKDEAGKGVGGARVLIITKNAAIQPCTRITSGDGGCNVYFNGPPFIPPLIVDIAVDAVGFVPWCTADLPILFGDESIDYQVTLRRPNQPSANLREFRTAFCIPRGFPDGRRIWTPAYGTYSAQDRAAIRTELRSRGYTHCVINCAGLPYGNDYPELADDPARLARDLDELEGDGLIPIICATDDRRGGQVANAFVQCADRIRVCFPMWEQNEKLGSAMQWKLVFATIGYATDALCFLHMTPDHSAIDADEPRSWADAQRAGVAGKFHQTNAFDDAERTGREMESMALRLAGKVGADEPLNIYHPEQHDVIPEAWRGLNLQTVRFEQCTTPVYQGEMSEAEQVAFDAVSRSFAPTTKGYCDGGE